MSRGANDLELIGARWVIGGVTEAMDEFGSRVVTMDPATVKKHYKDLEAGALDLKYASFVEQLTPRLEKLGKEVQTLINMHNARL